MKVVIIGSGNVATVLGRRMLAAGHEISQVISRNEEHASLLADKLKCSYASALEQIQQDSDFYVIAVSDSSLPEIANTLFLDKKLVVHTAGSVPKDVLRNVSRNYGVLYPLQSLRKEIGSTAEIPLLIDANTEDDLALIYDFARTISDQVKMAGDEERSKLHVGAIIVNNFTNYLYVLTEGYCKREQINFQLLLPLIRETASRLSAFSPVEVQTGPAVRNDFQTIEKHIELLAGYPDLQNIYRLITASIIGHYKERLS
jgi:predicted short-subunit dehydrogenase-like oxidoreductase (DUF2520 family)